MTCSQDVGVLRCSLHALEAEKRFTPRAKNLAHGNGGDDGSHLLVRAFANDIRVAARDRVRRGDVR